MKPSLLVALIVIIACTSCQKEYTCECISYGWNPGTSHHSVKAVNYEKARTKCLGMGHPGSYHTYGCDLQ